MSEVTQQARTIIEDPGRDWTKGFDDRVTIRDAKTGEIIRFQPFRLRIINSVRYYERPKGSCNLVYENGEHAGRFIDGQVDLSAKHVEFIEPKTITKEDLEQENAELRRELAAIQGTKQPGKAAEPAAAKEAKQTAEAPRK